MPEPTSCPKDDPDADLSGYIARVEAAWSQLFKAARAREELQFALALNPEFVGMEEGGWNTADEAMKALNEYVAHLDTIPPKQPIRVRVALSLYSHLSEAAGFYEVPKNMLNIASGGWYRSQPFSHLVARHTVTGAAVAPNANKVMKDLIGHALDLKQSALADVILEAFDPDLRNGYAHADYILWSDGIRLKKRNGGTRSIVSYGRFVSLLNKALLFFQVLNEERSKAIHSYLTPRRFLGRLGPGQPLQPAIVSFHQDTGRFRIQTGPNL